jgi:hypothetical protein
MLVQNKGKYVRHAEGVMLIPGANQLESEDFKKFSSHPIMKSLIEKEEIVAHEKAKSIKELHAEEAINLVKDTFTPSLLEEWKTVEKRKTVLDAIAEQLDVIKGEGGQNDD